MGAGGAQVARSEGRAQPLRVSGEVERLDPGHPDAGQPRQRSRQVRRDLLADGV